MLSEFQHRIPWDSGTRWEDRSMLTEEEKQKILELEDQGLSSYAIGKMMNRDPKTIASFLRDDNGETGTTTPPKNVRHKSRHGRPLVQDPSPALKHQREIAEGVDLELDIESRLKELRELKNGDTSIVRQKEDETKVTELSVREAKAKIELKNLQQEEEAQRRRAEHKALIERVKLACIPEVLREELPPPLLLLTLSAISAELSKMNLTLFTEGEVNAIAKIIRDKIWTDPQYFGTVKYAQVRAAFKSIDVAMNQEWKRWRESSVQTVCDIFLEEGVPPEATRAILERSNRFSYDEFLSQFFHDMLRHDPQGITEMFKGSTELLINTGNREVAEKYIGKMGKLYVAMQGHGGEILPLS